MVSLIVATLGRSQALSRLLLSLRAQTYGQFEIVLVDQNEPGFLTAVLDEFRDMTIVHLRSPKGLSRARNLGLASCRGDVVGFPDDDCWYAPHVLANVSDWFERHKGIGVLTGRTVDAVGNDSLSRFQRHSGPIRPSNVFVIGSSSTIFVRRGTAISAGGFDESLGVGAGTPFQSGEESDFILRCLNAGARGTFDRAHVVFHEQVSVSIDRARGYSVGFGRVARVQRLGLPFFAARSARTMAGACFRLLKGDVAGAHQRCAWLAGSVRGYMAPPASATSRQPEQAP
jgi:glycosyltransferase involved in cell wall biosynthesis